MTFVEGTVLFAAPHYGGDDKMDMIEEAKEYISKEKYTNKSVRIADTGDMIIVVKK